MKLICSGNVTLISQHGCDIVFYPSLTGTSSELSKIKLIEPVFNQTLLIHLSSIDCGNQILTLTIFLANQVQLKIQLR